MPKSRKDVAAEMLIAATDELTKLEIMRDFMEHRSRRVDLTAAGSFSTSGTAGTFRQLLKASEVQVKEKQELIDFLKTV